MHLCHKCGTEWVSDKPRPGFHEACANCSAYLHCCKNCRLYDPGAHNACRSSTTEYVADKARNNFCDEFEFVHIDKFKEEIGKDSAIEAFDSLFGGKLTKEGPQEPSDFDKLFGD